MRRRNFIALVGGAVAAWPPEAGAASGDARGFLNPASMEARRDLIAAFHPVLAKAGYAEGRNVTIEYRWAGGQNDRLPVMAVCRPGPASSSGDRGG